MGSVNVTDLFFSMYIFLIETKKIAKTYLKSCVKSYTGKNFFTVKITKTDGFIYIMLLNKIIIINSYVVRTNLIIMVVGSIIQIFLCVEKFYILLWKKCFDVGIDAGN